jgi:transcriptional regulator with XRE-family HTH domain
MKAPDEPRPEETFGAYIQRIRRERGMLQRTLADDLSIDFTYLSKLENGRGEPAGEDLIRRLAEKLQLDPEKLLALAGKVPLELREIAQQDYDFAVFLRRLPKMTAEERQRLYAVRSRARPR